MMNIDANEEGEKPATSIWERVKSGAQEQYTVFLTCDKDENFEAFPQACVVKRVINWASVITIALHTILWVTIFILWQMSNIQLSGILLMVVIPVGVVCIGCVIGTLILRRSLENWVWALGITIGMIAGIFGVIFLVFT